MTKTTINLSNVVSIEFLPERLDNTITYKKIPHFSLKKFKIITEWKYVDENYLCKRFLTEKELKERYQNQLLKNNELYYKAEVRVSMTGGKTVIKQFDTESEADLYYQALNRKLTNKTEL